MIFRIKKALYKEIDDFAIRAENFFVKVAKLLKGYYLYGKDGAQVAQIIFEKDKATAVAADSAPICICRAEQSYVVIDKTDEEEAGLNKKLRKQTSEFIIYGQPFLYRYDIYEIKAPSKSSRLAANVINDLASWDYYKVRALEGNILKIIMIALAIDKLNSDPDNRY
jgi:hypothetical protein